jgi:hypothetical protein
LIGVVYRYSPGTPGEITARRAGFETKMQKEVTCTLKGGKKK